MHRLPALVVVGCFVATGRAGADNTTFHGTAAGSVATTDNQGGTTENKRGAVFSDVRPGFLLTYNSPRHIHELLSEASLLYSLFDDRPTVTLRGGWKAFFLTGPRSEMSTEAEASKGILNALRATDSPTEMQTQLLPGGGVDTIQASGGENASYQATKFTRLSQRLFSRYGSTDDEDALLGDVTSESFELGGAFGIDRRFQSHNVRLELGGSYVFFDKFDPMLRQMGSRRDNQVNPRTVLLWQWDLNRQWSSNFDLGLVYVNPVAELFGRDLRDPYNPGEDRQDALFPTFGGVVAYADVWGRAQFDVRRAVTPNLLIAQNTINDQGNITFAMPLKFLDKSSRRSPRIVGVGTAGLARTRLVDPTTSEIEGTFNVARLDFAVAWQPRPSQTYGFRYEITYQKGDDVGEMVVPSYLRNTFYFTFALRYPEEIQVRVPRRPHQSMRADRGDLSPIGAEPVVIDPAELIEEGGR